MKAILVIDVPTESLENVIASVNICEQREGYNIILKRMGKMCLKPMPKEEDIYEVGMDEEDTNAKRQWNKGWNACLEEIMGETE